MKAAIDIGPLTSGDRVRGVGFYTRELIKSLEKELAKHKGITIDKLSSEKILQESHNYDIVHIPYFNPFSLTVPQKLNTKVVVNIHDATPLLFPKQYKPGLRGKMNFFRQKSRLRNVDAVIAISESAKKDIVRFYAVPKELVHVTHLAAGDHFKVLPKSSKVLSKTKSKYSLPKKYVLYAGDVNYNKNIPTLVEAANAAKVPLVIVGQQAEVVKQGYTTTLRNLEGPRDWARYVFGKPHPEHAHYEKLGRLIRKTKTTCTGFVPEEDFVAILNLATVYCQPSYAEGFGLPVVQSAMCGTQVIASKIQTLVEIAEDYATFFDGNSPKDLSKLLKKAFDNPKKLSNAKVNRIKKRFNWEKTAEETLQVYKSI
ncbi:glycosyltransferase family 4 protein [Patescibacteria group bacterium]